MPFGMGEAALTRARLVTDEDTVDAEPVPARAELRRSHHPPAVGAEDQLA
jgi:hypothetical protein